jgi:hypothetical protein
VPNYYVVQRALGYQYLKQVNTLSDQVNAAQSDAGENKRLTVLYTAAAKKTLPYLEKAQACDPNDETLTLIKLALQKHKGYARISHFKHTPRRPVQKLHRPA